MLKKYFVVRSKVGDLEFIKVMMAAFFEILRQHDVGFEFVSKSNPKETVTQWTFSEMDGRATVFLVDDLEMPPMEVAVRYVMLVGKPDFVEQVAPWLEEFLPVFPLRELQQLARGHMVDEPQLLYLMSLVTGDQPAPESVEILLEAMRSEDEMARITAVVTASVVPWKELVPEIQRLEMKDPSESVRKLAHDVLAMRP